jgi:YegS/Rv2252/BmrU family lipid kinase
MKALPAVRAELDELGMPHRDVVTHSIEHAVAEAARAAAAGECVVAIGGDGFAGPLSGALCGAEGALALVPAGRGNDFARTLGIPSEPRAAARIAAEGTERLVDVGEVDGRPFVGIASVGFDSDVQTIANRARVIGGRLVYLYAALRALGAWRPATFQAEVDGTPHTVHGYAVAVANSGTYGGGMRLVPHARLDDGRLDVLLVGAHSKLRYLGTLPKVFRGTHLAGNEFAGLADGTTVRLSADRPFTVYADGDPIGELPVTVRLRPGRVRVLTPAAR